MTIIDGAYIPPKRIQRQRRKGWRKPAGNVINCTRGSEKYSNPYRIGYPDPMITGHTMTRADTLRMYKWYAAQRKSDNPHWLDDFRRADYAMCFCSEDEDCHVDILLELA